MRLESIRWHLPLSYAAIALLCTLALGFVLLTTLRDYYIQREVDYLNGNADTINTAIAQMIEDGTPLAVIQAQIASYSFLSQVRIRVFDTIGTILADSGVPQGRNLLSISALPHEAPVEETTTRAQRSQSLQEAFYMMLAPEDYMGLQSYRTSIEVPIGISVASGTSEAEYYTPVITLDFVKTSSTASGDNGDDDVANTVGPLEYTHVLPATGTLNGFGLGDTIPGSSARSLQIARRVLVGSSGTQLGAIELSNGPAYGRQIVAQVARLWGVAGVMAIMVAATAGWAASRRITVPLISLTSVTRSMADGNLSVRATLNRRDELGILATAFNQMARRVEETVVTLRRFVADAAHEIHTPLTALNTNLELAMDETNWIARQTYVERARTQLKRLQILTDGLLDLSRIEAGVSNDQYRPIVLTDLVQEVSELYASRSEQAAVNFLLQLPDHPVTVFGNAGQLRSALSNLLDNAIKFTPSGETVSVELHKNDNWVEVIIQDHGIGIPADEMPYIFSRFHRCRNAVTYPGSGLGLAIVRGIADSHKGRITVRNTSPGTNFTLSLPLYAAGSSIG